jgi:ABC-2 type transport system ATP-binding protein
MPYTEILPPAVRVVGLTKRWGAHTVLDGLDLTVAPGSVYALLGPNGAGKSTFIRILTTLTTADAGVVEVAGQDVAADPDEVRRSISVTGQATAVDELLTGRENVRMVARVAGIRRRDADARADELLAQFDLLDAADQRAGSYSGGMRRRLDLAASLVVIPAVLFLDEPTTGLDTRSRQTLWRRIEELAAAGTTILLTTQYLEEADELADRIGVLDGGRLVAEGTAAELKARVGTEVLELTIACASGRQRAAELLGATPGGPNSIHVPTDGSAEHVRRVLEQLADHHINGVRVAVHTPSLDDVFLALTGGPVEVAA